MSQTRKWTWRMERLRISEEGSDGKDGDTVDEADAARAGRTETLWWVVREEAPQPALGTPGVYEELCPFILKKQNKTRLWDVTEDRAGDYSQFIDAATEVSTCHESRRFPNLQSRNLLSAPACLSYPEMC